MQKTMLAATLLFFTTAAGANLTCPADLDSWNRLQDANLFSTFGPRDPEGTGNRFHQGIDLFPNKEHEPINAIMAGVVTRIERRTNLGGNTIYVSLLESLAGLQQSQQFGYQHVFNDDPGDIKSGQFILGTRTFASKMRLALNVTGASVNNTCHVIFRRSPSDGVTDALVARGCAPNAREVVYSQGVSVPARSSVARKEGFASVGRSQTKDPHLHLNYYRGQANPLCVLANHEAPQYKAKLSTDGDREESSELRFDKTELPKTLWTLVDFTQGKDLDSVELVLRQKNGTVAATRQYSFGGMPGTAKVPSELNIRVTSSHECAAAVSDHAICASPWKQGVAGLELKKLGFAIRLPADLPAGDHKIEVTAKSVTGQMVLDKVPLAFSVVAKGRELTVTNIGSGNGRIVSSPTGIDCGGSASNCTAEFPADAEVTLTASPNAGYKFVNWGGDCAGTSASTSITMSADRSCTATYALDDDTNAPASLTVHPQSRSWIILRTNLGSLGQVLNYDHEFTFSATITGPIGAIVAINEGTGDLLSGGAPTQVLSCGAWTSTTYPVPVSSGAIWQWPGCMRMAGSPSSTTISVRQVQRYYSANIHGVQWGFAPRGPGGLVIFDDIRPIFP